jgi:hypothetical protein
VNEENQISYYSVIPATIRYDNRLKPAEKLIYSEITSLTNRIGYCFASNKYFANLYGVTIHTVSQWISHLEKLEYVYIKLIRDTNKEIKERRIYINDTPYVQKNTYPYIFKSTYPIYKNVQDNNINSNIDDLFNFIINNSNKIPRKFYNILDRLEFLYTEEILNIMQKDKVQMLKEIIYILYDIYNSSFNNLLSQVKRESLINLYTLSQEHSPDDLLNYYKRTIINKYTNNST